MKHLILPAPDSDCTSAFPIVPGRKELKTSEPKKELSLNQANLPSSKLFRLFTFALNYLSSYYVKPYGEIGDIQNNIIFA